jgi:hypothetical protein
MRLMRMTRAVALTILAFASAACTAHASAPAEGTVSGSFVRVGGPYHGSAVPLSGKITLTSSRHHYEATVNADGLFRVRVAPGSYQVTGTSPEINSGTTPCREAVPVVVAAGSETKKQVTCQIK